MRVRDAFLLGCLAVFGALVGACSPRGGLFEGQPAMNVAEGTEHLRRLLAETHHAVAPERALEPRIDIGPTVRALAVPGSGLVHIGGDTPCLPPAPER